MGHESMRTLEIYIGRTLFTAYGVVLSILLSLFAFLTFVQQADAIVNDRYTVGDAAMYVALTLPQDALDLAPITALLGGLLGLGMLGRGNELVAMLTFGVPLRRLVWSVGRPAIVLAAGCALVSEFVAPPLHHLAEQNRVSAMAKNAVRVDGDGFWSRDGARVLHVGGMWKGQIPESVEVYEFDAQRRLGRYLYADRADPQHDHAWNLDDAREKTFAGESITYRRQTLVWNSFITPREFDDLRLSPQSLSSLSLYQYIRYLKEAHQPSAHFEIVFWQKALLPLSVWVMALLAVPFGFVLSRRNSFQQVTVGTAVGSLLFLLDRLTATTIPRYNPGFTAALPLIVMVGLAGYLFWRIARKGFAFQ
jgi:lipopolysaccharide export system permease protein